MELLVYYDNYMKCIFPLERKKNKLFYQCAFLLNREKVIERSRTSSG